ncbi:hypothetical protein [Streptacidiphilus fuscans]|uniref:Uncharacterized protein n=1 Tax=Streptacidiphilus fuscans TaxID=2789292 RepID=A0A931B6U9_9ACTN|nr:hypothetical protein [Streptacidiphilus fuscans]MBF9067995.1 hypothetical protein [Streptacidiphilus fuscans]
MAVSSGIAVGLGVTLLVDALADASGYHPAEHSALLRLADWAAHSSAWQSTSMLLAMATAFLLIRAERASRLGPAGPLAAVAVASAAGWFDGVPGTRLPVPLLGALAVLAFLGPYRTRWALGALVAAGLVGVVPLPVAAAVAACAAARAVGRVAPDPRREPFAAVAGAALVAAAVVV